MKLECLPYIFEIDRLHSISAAARSLRIQQTTLSSILKSLEDELGYPIFQRSPSGVMLSPRGELFITYAEEMYNRYQEMIQLSPSVSTDASNVVCLMSSMLMNQAAIPVTQMFTQQYPHSSIIFRETSTSSIFRQLENGESNVALSFISRQEYLAQKRQNLLNVHLLAKDRFVLLVSPSHPLAEKTSVCAAELHNEKIASSKRLVNNLVLRSLTTSNHITVISDVDLVLDAVQSMNMIAFVPTLLLPKHRQESFVSLEYLDSQEDNLLYLCLLTAKNARMSNQEMALVTCIQDYFQPYAEALETDREKGSSS